MKIKMLKNMVTTVLKAICLTLGVTTLSLAVNAQTTKNMVPGTEIYTAVQEQARFPGGLEGFATYLEKNIHYPDAAKKDKVQGRVFLQFVVEKDGSLSMIKVIRGIGSGCDEEALRVINNSPKWTPGKQDGQIVRSQYTVPIMFSLTKS